MMALPRMILCGEVVATGIVSRVITSRADSFCCFFEEALFTGLP
jgi:hypothetical protein